MKSWCALITIAVASHLAAYGCASKPWYVGMTATEQWSYLNRHQPVYRLVDDFWRVKEGCCDAADLPDPTRPEPEGTLAFSAEHGGYEVFTGPGASLVRGPGGEPLWAGQWIVPCREDGRISGLYLFDSCRDVFIGGEEHRRYDLCRISRLRFCDDGDVYEQSYSQGYVRIDDTGPAPWVMDVDGDGTDEVCIAVPRFGKRLRSRSMRWDLVLMGPIPVRGCGGLQEHLAAPLSVPAPDVVLRLSERPRRELRILADQHYDQPYDESKLVPLGSIIRSVEGGGWQFLPRSGAEKRGE